jgi:hypothetical protein
MTEIDESIAKLRQMGFKTKTVGNRVMVDLGRGATISLLAQQLGRVTTLLSKGNKKLEAVTHRTAKANIRKKRKMISRHKRTKLASSTRLRTGSVETQKDNRWNWGLPCPGGLPSLGKRR